jgi:imidazole glycerol-phosphate synthase subunit HisH
MITIIDYGSGNIHSVHKAFERTGKAVKVTDRAEDLRNATHIVLPGVGAFGDCIKGLSSLPNMLSKLEKQVLQNGKPFFGICVGMQMLATEGYERGKHKGLGWIEGEVMHLEPSDKTLRIPHIGWNNIENIRDDSPMKAIKSGEHVYFVHSYQFIPANEGDIAATTEYGGRVVAAINRGNIFGTQFHPEKSQEAGRKIIERFLSACHTGEGQYPS